MISERGTPISMTPMLSAPGHIAFLSQFMFLFTLMVSTIPVTLPLMTTNHTCAAIGCGSHDNECWCTDTCYVHKSCCVDYTSMCETAGAHSCTSLGCGGIDDMCSCSETCASQGNCCDDYNATCSSTSTSAFELRDVNIFITTDTHSWLSGHHPHDDELNATFADIVDVVEAARESAAASGQDVFFFDNGDIQDGTGLSAAAPDHVQYLKPLLEVAPYDALNCGNHELYQLDGCGELERAEVAGAAGCGIVGLNESGFIAHWNGSYLTSNIFWASNDHRDGESVGSQYAIVRGAHGRSLLVFGFLYHMKDHCDAVQVKSVGEVLRESWFSSVVAEHTRNVSAVVVLAHMDNDDENVDLIVDAVRAAAANATNGSTTDAALPVLVLTGHSHQRKFRNIDSQAAALEAGCKLETLGFASFDLKDDKRERRALTGGDSADQWDIYTATVDGNTASLSAAISGTTGGVIPQSTAGDVVRAALAKTRAALLLDAPLMGADGTPGGVSSTLSVDEPMSSPTSFWSFYMNTVVQATLFPALAQQEAESGQDPLPGYHLLGTGAFVYDLYAGNVTIDDCFKTSPYANWYFRATGGVSGSVLRALTDQLNDLGGGETGDRLKSPLLYDRLRERNPVEKLSPSSNDSSLPLFAASTDILDANTSYAFIYNDYDAAYIEPVLLELTGIDYSQNREVFWPGNNDTSLLVEYFQL